MNIQKTIFLLSILISSQAISQDNCAVFDGIDDHISYGDVLDLGTSDFTVEAWFYSTTTNGTGQKIVNKGLSSVGTPVNAGYGFRIFDQTLPDDLDFSMGDALGNNIRLLYNGVSLNEWHHVAATRRGVEVKMYFDGVMIDSAMTSVVYNVDSNLPFGIGALDKMGLSFTGEFMNGKIDEVRIWSAVRSGIEIVNNMNCAITSPRPNLLAVYNLNENTGLIASDAAGGGFDGALEGGTSWEASPVALICSVSLDESDINASILIYPNPFDQYIRIEGAPKNSQVNLYTSTGQLILSKKLINDQLFIPEIEHGTYVLEIQGDAFIQRYKVIK